MSIQILELYSNQESNPNPNRKSELVEISNDHDDTTMQKKLTNRVLNYLPPLGQDQAPEA